MNAKILNTIIGFSLLGIVGLLARDYFFPSKAASDTYVSPTPIAAPVKKAHIDDPVVPCANTYFNLQKGTTWKYRVKSELDFNKTKNKINKIFINKVVDTSTSSATIETSYPATKKVSTTKMICKKTGVYGVPYPFLDEDLLASASGKMAMISGVSLQPTLLLPPQDRMGIGASWQSPLQPDLQLTIPFFNFRVFFTNKVTDVKDMLLYGMPRSVVAVESKLETENMPIDIIKDSAGQRMQSQFGEGIGLLNANLNLNFSSLGHLQWNVELLDFKEALIPARLSN